MAGKSGRSEGEAHFGFTESEFAGGSSWSNGNGLPPQRRLGLDAASVRKCDYTLNARIVGNLPKGPRLGVDRYQSIVVM